MSANQAMSSARRRRGAPPQTTPSIQTSGPNRGQQIPSGKQPLRPATPVVSNEKVQPLALLAQHDRRLWSLENEVPQALDTIHGNIEVLREGFNTLIEEGEQTGGSATGGGEASFQTKVNTALTEALASKTLAASANNAIESFRVNEIRELQSANEELRTDIAELRQLVESMRRGASCHGQNDEVDRVSLEVESG